MGTRTVPEPGIAAKFEAVCPRCSGDIRRGTRVVFQRGVYIHVTCASGQDDE
ncbi:MAG TPA: hypothetical protein VLI04_08145 [Nocardioidaceae bacterium]|nr:hypothetical protein [Nocardioidaceae bacterium]